MPCQSTSMVRFERYAGSTQERPSSRKRRPEWRATRRVQLEFVAGIEAAGDGGALLPQQAIGADDLVGVGAGNRRVEHQQMVASLVETVGVALLQRMQQLALGAQLLIEYAEPHLLRGGDLGRVARQTDFQRSDPAKRAARRDSGAFPAQQRHIPWGPDEFLAPSVLIARVILLRAIPLGAGIRGQCNRIVTVP